MVLYDNPGHGMDGPVTLSRDPSEFSRLDIQLKTNDGDLFSASVLDPGDGMRFNASTVRWQGNNDTVWAKCRLYEIDGATIETANVSGVYQNGEINIATGEKNYGACVTIVKVVGVP